jgi:hypothetical protein
MNTAGVPAWEGLRPRQAARALALAPEHIVFRRLKSVGAQDKVKFAAQWLACTLPCRRFAVILAECLRTARRRCGSLHLHRSGLAPSAPCRSPGALKLLLPPRQSLGVSL